MTIMHMWIICLLHLCFYKLNSLYIQQNIHEKDYKGVSSTKSTWSTNCFFSFLFFFSYLSSVEEWSDLDKAVTLLAFQLKACFYNKEFESYWNLYTETWEWCSSSSKTVVSIYSIISCSWPRNIAYLLAALLGGSQGPRRFRCSSVVSEFVAPCLWVLRRWEVPCCELPWCFLPMLFESRWTELAEKRWWTCIWWLRVISELFPLTFTNKMTSLSLVSSDHQLCGIPSTNSSKVWNSWWCIEISTTWSGFITPAAGVTYYSRLKHLFLSRYQILWQ